MSSQDQKPLKKAKPELDDSDDGMSLGALLQEKRKKLLNVGSKLLSKPKKEELLGVDGLGKSPKIDSGSAPKGSKVKKEERFNSVNDDFDEKPAKKSSAAKRDTVHISFYLVFLSHFASVIVWISECLKVEVLM